MAKEKNRFNFQQVAKTIGDKLVRRHPHVFGKSSRKINDINRKWEELKRLEKPSRQSALDGLPHSLPALLRAQRMHEKIAQNTPSPDGRASRELHLAWKNLQKGMKGSKLAREKAAGEFLLKFAQFSQAEGIHAEMALIRATAIYEKHFRKTEKIK